MRREWVLVLRVEMRVKKGLRWVGVVSTFMVVVVVVVVVVGGREGSRQ